MEIPEGWEIQELDQVVNIHRNSIDPKKLGNEEVLLYSLPGFDNNRTVDEINASQIGSNKYEIFTDYVLFSKLNPEKKRIWHVLLNTNKRQICSTEFWGIEARKDKVRSDFLKHFFLFDNFINHPFISPASSTNSHKRVDLRSFKRIKLVFPPIPEQQKIASILSSVDAAIFSTKTLIEKTQTLKKGLMQQLLARGIPGMHTEFKESKLGRIPKCWEVKKLEDIADVNRGKFTHRPRNEPIMYNGKYPFIQTGDVKRQLGKLVDYTQTLSEKGIKVSREFPIDTIIITIAANIGETAISTFPIYFPDSLIGINPKDEINVEFLEFFLRTRKEYLNSIASQNAQKNINLEKLNPLQIVVPNLFEQTKISSILLKIESIEKDLISETVKMKNMKKSLMQQLLTGKIRVDTNE